MDDDVKYQREMAKGRWQTKRKFYYKKALPLNLIESLKMISVNNSTELKNFSSFDNCFQPATIQNYIKFKSATIQTN